MSAILKAASITGKIGSGGILIGAKEAVQYIPQELTEEQQIQARDNIEAVGKNELDEIKRDIDYLHPLEITKFSISPSMAEKGSIVGQQTFYYNVNRIAAEVTLNGENVSDGSATRTDTLTENTSYTLIAKLNEVSKSATAKVQFVAPIYYGVSATYELSNSTVLALTRLLASSRAKTFSVNAASGQYILYALPFSLGTPVFKVGGFEGGFVLVGTFDFTNSSGYSESYNLYRSANAGLGSTTVSVT